MAKRKTTAKKKDFKIGVVGVGRMEQIWPATSQTSAFASVRYMTRITALKRSQD